MNIASLPAAIAAAAPLISTGRADQICQAARTLLPFLEGGRTIGAADLRTSMTNACGGTDAEGF